MKHAIGKSSRKVLTNNNGKETTSGDGWEGFEDEDVLGEDEDAEEDDSLDISQFEKCAQLSVELKKAQSACEQLTEQLTKAETQRDEVLWGKIKG